MKKILSLLLILFSFAQVGVSQLGTPVVPNTPDTIQVQFLVKRDVMAHIQYVTPVDIRLQGLEIGYEFLFYQKPNYITYTLKCWGIEKFFVLEIVQGEYPDAYYINSKGERTFH